MKIEKKTDESNKKLITISYDGNDWKKLLKDIEKQENEKFQEILKKSPDNKDQKLPGKIERNALIKIAANEAIKKMSTDEKIKDDLKPSQDEDSIIEIIEATEDKLSVQFSFFDKPILDLTFIKDIKIDVPKKPRVNENELNKYMEDILKSKAKRTNVNREAKNGDVVNIDFSGTIEGQDFENGSAKNYNLELGSKKFIPGFEENLVGVKEKETKTFEVDFPENYPYKHLASKKAKFDVKVNRVVELDVPTLSNDLVKEFNIPNIADISSFRNYCKNNMMQQVVAQYQQQVTNLVVMQILTKLDFQIPKRLKDLEIRITRTLFTNQAAKSNLTEKQFATRNGLDPEKYDLQLEAIAVNKIKLSYVLRQYIIDKKVVVSDEEYNKAYEIFKRQNYIDPKSITYQEFRNRYINDVALNRITELIISNSQKI